MQQTNLAAEWQGRHDNIKLNVQLLLFEEDNIHFAYIPSLDLTSYGNTPDEARGSLSVVIDEFLRYTTNKKTVLQGLERLGWKVKPKQKPMVAPQLSDLVKINEQLRDIVDQKQFSASLYQINIPAVA